MEGLDFTELTDDQLIGLLRAVLRECVARGGAVGAAAHAAGLDEAERARIAEEAAEREAAKLRAQERERIAKEAAEEVRLRRQAQEAAARAAQAEGRRKEEEEAARLKAEALKREAAEAVAKAEQRDRERMGWLRRFAALVGREPGEIHILRYQSRYGWRVIVNEGSDRYASDHLVDYYPETATIKTRRALVPKKKNLLTLCAEFWALNPAVQTSYFGSEYSWEEETAHAS